MSVPSHGYSLRSRTQPTSPHRATASSPRSTSSTPPSSHTSSSPPSYTSHATLSVPYTNAPPVSPTKRKLDDTSSDEDDYEHIGSAGDKLHEFHKVKISSRAESEIRDPAKIELSPQPVLPTQPASPPFLQQLSPPQPTTTTTTTTTTQQQTTSSPQVSTPPQTGMPANITYTPSSWGYITSRGGRKENQDFYIVPHEDMIDAKNQNTALMFGVYDGHGIKGLEAARDCGRCVLAHFAASNSRAQEGAKTQEWVDLTLRDAFKHAQDVLLQVEAKSKQVLDYGTTACVAVIRPALNELTIAWVGDARAAVVRWEAVVSTPLISAEDMDSGSGSGLSERATTFIYNNSTSNSNLINSPTDTTRNNSKSELARTGSKGSDEGACSPFLTNESAPGSPASSTTTVEDTNTTVQPTLQVLELTTDHVPQREDERARVLQQGGVIRRVGNVVRVVAGGNFTEEQLKQQRLALNITRSLGHAILSQYGISAEPDVLKTTMQADDILVIASDGLWNELSSSEISGIALECKMAGFSPQKFCNMLLRRAEVVSKLKGVLSDNITIVVYHHINT